jgi:hypothetical protein
VPQQSHGLRKRSPASAAGRFAYLTGEEGTVVGCEEGHGSGRLRGVHPDPVPA